jgi:anti-sigma factor RsiW
LARSRKPRPRASAPQNGRGRERLTTEERMARGYARGRERDAAARAKLKPLAPGERPLAVTLAAILAAVLGLANVVLLAVGYDVDDNGQSVAGVLIFAALMAAAAIGMWQCRYWAVLGFEALLGIAIVFAALSLMVASNVGAVLLCLAIIAIASPLFWFLIRAMARIQLPSRRPREPVG